MPNWTDRIEWSRALSLLIAAVYVLIPILAGRGRPVREVTAAVMAFAIYLPLPLACIWFSDEIGEYTGRLPGPAINRPTPGWMVACGGWFLLFLPVLTFLFSLYGS